jgi:methyl-accepting chemotaxis protein
MFLKIKIKNQFIYASTALIIVTLANNIASHYTVTTMEGLTQKLGQASQIQIQQIEAGRMFDAIGYDVQQLRAASMLTNIDTHQKASANLKQHIGQLDKALAGLAQANVDKAAKEKIAAVIQQFEEYKMQATAVMQAYDNVFLLQGSAAAFTKQQETLAKSQEEYTSVIAQAFTDLQSQYQQVTMQGKLLMLCLTLLNIGIAISIPAYAIWAMFRPQAKMIDSMKSIAKGDTQTAIPYTDRHNEIGEMARTVSVFKENAARVAEMATTQKAQQEKSEAEKRKAMEELAGTFEANVKSVVDIVASAAAEMDNTAQSVAKTANANQSKLQTLRSEIDTTTNNVETVANASEQLSAAITEISQQVSRATVITTSAVEAARKTSHTAQGLTTAASKIGEVVEMINSIAAQINLLALNATIEAARAGEAGRGFAVVASEVKTLATQTTKATEQIGEYITSIQHASNDTASAIESISKTIDEINNISTTIAAAVEEQSATTHDISQNVKMASETTKHVSQSAGEVTAASEQTGQSAKEMLSATTELSRQSEVLRSEVSKFLTGMRESA